MMIYSSKYYFCLDEIQKSNANHYQRQRKPTSSTSIIGATTVILSSQTPTSPKDNSSNSNHTLEWSVLSLKAFPQASSNDTANSKQNAKSDAQAPNSLCLKADIGACTSPNEIIHRTHVRRHGFEKSIRITTSGAQGLAVKI